MSRETHTEETKEGWLYRPDLSVCCTTVSVPVCLSHADSNPHLLSLSAPESNTRGAWYTELCLICVGRKEAWNYPPLHRGLRRVAAPQSTGEWDPLLGAGASTKVTDPSQKKKERKEGDGERSWYVWITLWTWQKNQGQGPGRKFWAPDYILTNESRRISDPKLKNVWFQSRFLSLFLWSWGYWKRQWRPIAIVLLSRWT